MDALLPPATALFVAWAKDHPALRSLHGGRVDVQLAGAYPALRVTRLGGTPRGPEWEDRPEVQVDCWARTEPQADQLARTLIAVIPDLNGNRPPHGRVQGAYKSYGPLWSPGDGLSRYLLQVSWLAYPLTQ